MAARLKLTGPVGYGKGLQTALTTKRSPARALPPAGYIRLRTADDSAEVLAELDGYVIPAGYGGHETIDIPGQDPLTSYTGGIAKTLPLSLILDQWSPQGSISDDIATLEQLAGWYGEPPAIVLEARAMLHGAAREPGSQWVITSLEWTEIRPRERDGVAAYATAAALVMRYDRPSDDLIESTLTRELHTVSAGSELLTLKKIARHYKLTWTRLRALNPDLPADPNKTLKLGTRVRLG